MIENIYNPIIIKLNFKTSLKIIFSASIFLFFILASSIHRGYGDFNTKNILDAIKFIPDYAATDIFVDAAGENLELNFVYTNAINATDLFITGEQELLYGETFIKALFVPIPRSLFGYKPRALIKIYSPKVDIPGVKEVTSPVVVYVEFFWNFGLLFFVFLFIMIYYMDKIHFYAIRRIKEKGLSFYTLLIVFWYTINIQFIRGSGLDLLFLYIIVGIPFAYVLIKFNKLKLNIY